MTCAAGFDAWYLLGVPANGHKLRGLYVPDTAIVDSNVLKAWFYTDKQTGVLHATSRSQLSTAALLQKLTGQHALYESNNPDGWVAVAYFANYITRLVTFRELQDLLSQIYVGAVPDQAAEDAAAGLQLLALQAYIVPSEDARYITTFGGIEGAATVTQVRSYSSRFTSAAQQVAVAEATQAVIRQAIVAGTAAAAVTGQLVYEASAAESGSAEEDASAASPPPINPASPTRGSCCGSVISLCPNEAFACDVGHSSPADCSSTGYGDSNYPAAGKPSRLQDQQTANFGDIRMDAENSTQPNDGWVTPALPAYHDSLDTSNSSAHESSAGYCNYASTTASVTADSRGRPVGSQSSRTAAGARQVDVQAAPGRVAKAAAEAVQLLVSYLDKAYGLRVQGLVAEFIKDQEQQLWMIGLHNVSVDPQQSRGSSATFTERWADFLAGAAPPPAPCVSQHTTYGSCVAVASTAADVAATAQSTRSSLRHGGSTSVSLSQQLNRQFFPLLSVDLSELPRCRPQSADAAFCNRHSNRPVSAPRSIRAASPQVQRPSTSPSRQRPATAAAGLSASIDSSIVGVSTSVLQGSSRVAGSIGASCSHTAKGGGGANYTRRNAASVARPGAGGNPTSKISCNDSYNLWMQQPVRPENSITAQLAAQLESAKEQLQQYANLAETAQLQASSVTQQAAEQVSSVQQELLQLRHDAAAASRERRQLQQQILNLEEQRNSSTAAIVALQQQLAEMQEQLAQDRSTLATMLRQHQQQKQQLEEEVTQLQQQNHDLRSTSHQLASRLDEESEVVSALRAQLVDYKLQMEQIQLQAKKGRSMHSQISTPGNMKRGGANTPPVAAGGFAAATFSSSNGLGLGSSSGLSHSAKAATLVSLSGGAGAAAADTAAGSWSLNSSIKRRSPAAGQLTGQSEQYNRTPSSNALGQSLLGMTPRANSTKASLAAATQSSSNSRRSTSECLAAAQGSSLGRQAATATNSAATDGRSIVTVHSCAAVGPGTLLLQQMQQRSQALQPVSGRGSLQQQQQQQAPDLPQPQQQQQQQRHTADPEAVAAGLIAVQPSTSSSGCSSGTKAATLPQQQHQPSLQEQQQQQQQSPKHASETKATASPANLNDPDAVIASITAGIKSELRDPLACSSNTKPQLFIGDLLVDEEGVVAPTAMQQLVVISGLFQELAGDLLEIYSYYALLGGSVQVVADRMTMDLKSLGKLAYDLHIPQDRKSLSAVEDVFYLLSDRRPCLALRHKTRAPSPERLASRAGHTLGSSSNGANQTMFGAAAAAAAAAAGSAYLGPGQQHAVARAAAWEHMGTDPEATSTAAAAAAAVMVSVLGPEVIVPEQFPEALIRLACVRYRWGVINNEYDWDDSDSDWDSQEEEYEEGGGADAQQIAGSLRMQRMQMQTGKQHHGRHGPKVLRPEGKELYEIPPPSVALRSNNSPSSSRSPSPSRAATEYAMPTSQDDLVHVVRTFMQYEVLKHARRNKLAGSSLGHRRAQVKQPNLMGWDELPAGVIRD